MQCNGMGHAWVHHDDDECSVTEWVMLGYYDDDECSVTEWVMPGCIMMMINAV